MGADGLYLNNGSLSKGTERGAATISELGNDVDTENSYRSHLSDHASDPAELLGSASWPYTLCYGRGKQPTGAHVVL